MVKLGDKIRIIEMKGEPEYTSKLGEVTVIDGIGRKISYLKKFFNFFRGNLTIQK